MMLQNPISPTKAKEVEPDGSNVDGHLMDVAEDESDNGTRPPTETVASMIPPVPTKNQNGTI
jgi:hypothetical protein